MVARGAQHCAAGRNVAPISAGSFRRFRKYRHEESLLSPLLSFLEDVLFCDAARRAAAELLDVSTNAPLKTESRIFDLLHIDGPILKIANIELIFVNR